MPSLHDVPLNVLDLAPIEAGGSNTAALTGSVALAQAAERLGYHRFWVAEHHSMPAIASSAPAVLIAGIAARTERIRVGSGGVILPNHAPFVVAEQFGTLRGLYGDRIDLGIGRAPATDAATAAALRRADNAAAEFPQQLAELIGFFGDAESEVVAIPGRGDTPELWLLGSSNTGAELAAKLGIRFAFAHHLAGNGTEAALELYRSNFQPSEFLREPYTMVAVNLVTGDSAEIARAQSLPSAIGFIQLQQGRRPQPVSVEDALAYDFQPWEIEFTEQRDARQAVGTPERVESQLGSLLASTGADELILQAAAATLEGRIRSIEIVAELAGRS
ncbi:MAG: LLM class flavin-dependent oxidoreductase [Galbitalea sp.]